MTVNLDYATAVELREQLGGKKAQDDDLVLRFLIRSAAQTINNILKRKDGFIALTEAESRVYVGDGDYFQYIDDCIAITAVAVKDSPTDTAYTAWTTADWIAGTGSPEYPDYNSLPYDLLMVNPTGSQANFTSGYLLYGGHKRGFPTVQVTAKWGYSETVPHDIKEACIAQAARWYKRGEGGWSDVTAATGEGQLVYRELDSDIQLMLMHTRYWQPSFARW